MYDEINHYPNDENSYIENLRVSIENQYLANPTGCGGSFGELLCWEIHTNDLTFTQLAEKWGIGVTTVGELLYDHCKRMEKLPTVDHNYEKS